MKHENMSADKRAQDLVVCREIVSRIMEFGVSESQLHTLIFLLAMQLENVELMKKIATLIRNDQNNPFITPLLSGDDELT